MNTIMHIRRRQWVPAREVKISGNTSIPLLFYNSWSNGLDYEVIKLRDNWIDKAFDML